MVFNRKQQLDRIPVLLAVVTNHVTYNVSFVVPVDDNVMKLISNNLVTLPTVTFRIQTARKLFSIR